MKRGLIFSLFILLIGIGFVSAELSNYSTDCTDSDSGLNYYIKGTAVYNNYDYQDSCVTSDAVVNEGQPNEYKLEVGDLEEYACYYPKNTQKCYSTTCPFIKYHCPYGCKEGACLSASSNIPSCMSNQPVYGEAWYDNNGLITNSSCLSCSPICDKVGTSEEGWYSSCDNSLIKLDACDYIENNSGCSDSDGKNPSQKGNATLNSGLFWDYCIIGKPILVEKYCSNGEIKEANYQCSGGCSDGACIGKAIPLEIEKVPENACVDFDNGENYYIQGKIKGTFQGDSNFEDEDFCSLYNPNDSEGRDVRVNSCGQYPENHCSVREYTCASNETAGLTSFTCIYGCKSGACLERPLIEPNETNKIIEVPDEIISNYDCNGCKEDNKCYFIGYRKSGQYCSDNNAFIDYKASKAICDNNFECKSNVCISGECISEGLIKRILDWFSRLFGGE